MADPTHEWWDDQTTPDERESRDEILAEAFRKGFRKAVEELGEKMDKWEWGKVHTAEFRNQTFGESVIGPIESIFNRGPVAMAGGSTQVNRASWDMEEPYHVYHIASQ